MTGTTIRLLTAADAEAFRALRLAALREEPPAFGTPAEEEEVLPLAAFAFRLQESDDKFVLGAFVEETLVGTVRFSRFEASNEKHRGFLGSVYVSPQARRRGLARALVVEALSRARRDSGLRRVHLSVVTEQGAAIALYKSLGFLVLATQREAFSRGGRFYDEHLMELLLR